MSIVSSIGDIANRATSLLRPDLEWLSLLWDIVKHEPEHILPDVGFLVQYFPPLGFARYLESRVKNLPLLDVKRKLEGVDIAGGTSRLLGQLGYGPYTRLSREALNNLLGEVEEEEPNRPEAYRYIWIILTLATRSVVVPSIGLSVTEADIGAGRKLKVPITFDISFPDVKNEFVEVLLLGFPSPTQIWRWWGEWVSGFFGWRDPEEHFQSHQPLQDPLRALDALWMMVIYVLQPISLNISWFQRLLQTGFGGEGLGEMLYATNSVRAFLSLVGEGRKEYYERMIREIHLVAWVPYPNVAIDMATNKTADFVRCTVEGKVLYYNWTAYNINQEEAKASLL